MAWLSKHVGLAKHVGDFRFKRWLDGNALKVLAEIGVEKGQKVLDFGCGSGIYTIPAAKIVGKDGKVYALDISRRSLNGLMKKVKQEGLENVLRVDVTEGERLPIDGEAIDLILLIDVLQEVDDRNVLFDEVYRILKPEGAFVIYPMHLAEEEVERLAANRGFFLGDRKIRGRVLIFRK